MPLVQKYNPLSGNFDLVHSESSFPTVVANYSALPAANTVTGQFYWAKASQGTAWLPGSLGGTYYSAGMYYSNGISWEFLAVPYQATLAEVNTGTNTDKFVTPSTLSNSDYAFTNEKAQDAVGNILTDSSRIDLTYNDGLNTITADILTDSVDNTFLANMSQATIKGRASGAGTGDPTDLTGSQVKTIQGLATSSTDNAIVRYDGTSGNTQNSTVTVEDDGSIILPSISNPSYTTAGRLLYDVDNDTLGFFNSNSSVFLQVGEEVWMRCRNTSGSTITNGSAVYVNGSSSGLPTIALAQANSATTTVCAGLVTHDLANNTNGFVTVIGTVRSLNTSGLSVGNVFLSSSVAGGLTNTAPTSPNYRYRIGFVTNVNATTGTVQVTPTTAAVGNGTTGQVLGINGSGNQAFLNANEIVGYQGYTLQAISANTSISPLDSTTYYSGSIIGSTVSTTAGIRRMYIPKNGTIVGCVTTFITGSAGSNESSTISIRLNNTTDTTLSSAVVLNTTIYTINTTLSIAVTTSDYVEIKWVTPAWGTNPASVAWATTIYIQ